MGVRSVVSMHQRVGDGVGTAVAVLSDLSVDLERVLGSPEWWRLSGRELVASVDAAYRLVAQAQAVALSLLGEFDARRLGMEAGAVSTAGWLTARRRIRPQDAKRDVVLAQLLHTAETAAVDGTVADEPVAGDGAAGAGWRVRRCGLVWWRVR